MATSDCETKSSKAPKFCELNQPEQIEKLRYELQMALRAISYLGNKVVTIQEHQHGANGEVTVHLSRTGRVFEPDRSKFLD